ncbi:OmpA-OmpF porin, OOP family [Shimia gijangensis]|uniref:OmpA-OmpF porin, OOP family n=1 Tax=Shimia gijangensis TaxID=1470563 RepID=A0A1M6JGN6_9RHOB|nr:OmpA family protein [Shimia gijangensis]SHJ45762.1 OmpA-OmpF porin, OOP family [Shimia gijangensis]
MIFRTAIALAVLPQLALAFEPALPTGARQVALEDRPRTAYELPIGPFRNGALPSERYLGLVQLRSWRMEEKTSALTEISAELARQLVSEGYEIVFRCETEDCGGFDFRFNTLVLPPPEMFVDLSSFRFLSARRETDQGTEAVSLFLSRTSRAAILQAVCVTPMERVTLTIDPEPKTDALLVPTLVTPPSNSGALSADTIGDLLIAQGHLILEDLTFDTGSANLTDGNYKTLNALADWLLQDENRKVALVGHTDSQGALDSNVELSRNRAKSVQAHLTDTYKVPQAQLDAQGIGYLSPIASNAGKEGRDANRRVEVVLLSGS